MVTHYSSTTKYTCYFMFSAPLTNCAMYLRVFLVESLGFPRSHHAIFVETSPAGGGHIFQVTGNVQQGMRYETKVTDSAPSDDPSYEGKTQLGSVALEDFSRIDAVCKLNPAPEKQFEGVKKITTYPVRRCQEWTAETVELLKQQDVLVVDVAHVDDENDVEYEASRGINQPDEVARGVIP